MQPEPHIPHDLSVSGARLLATETFTLLKAPPPAGLDHLVHDIALYRESARQPIRQVETASLVIPVLIGFAEPFDIALGRQPSTDDSYRSFVSGLTLKPVHIRSAGACSCLEFTLTPLGARRFFGLPMGELTERMVRLEDLGDTELARLRQQLGEERDWWNRLRLAQAFLVRRLRGETDPAVSAAYRSIVRSGGRMPIQRIADKIGWSRKHLAARFRQEVGLPPKAVARVARFSAAQAMASAGDDGWADIAAACGYSDQPHLVREFRELAGITPAEWRAGTL